MSAAPKLVQATMDLTTQEEIEQRVDHTVKVFTDLMACIRAAVTANGGSEKVANELDAIWGHQRIGRGVSPSTFKATLATNGERNYFRIDWIIWLAEHSTEFADFLRGLADGRFTKTADEELSDLHELLRRKYPEDADVIIRKARAVRKRR